MNAEVPNWLEPGFLNDQDLEVIARGGYGKTRGYGHRPCLMIIDCQYNHIGARKHILDQLDEWPAGGGEAAWAAVANIQRLLTSARERGVPVVFTRFCHTRRAARFDAFAAKRGRKLDRFLCDSETAAIVQELEPRDDELVVDKTHASAFYGTSLTTYVISQRIDTLIACGVSTSGCVRSTVIDAVSMGLNAAVVADAVADRLSVSHNASLVDLWMKYADVHESDSVLSYFQELRNDRD